MKNMKPTAGKAIMNSTVKSREKSHVNTGSAGPEKKAAMKSAADGFPSGGLRRAIHELGSQNHEMGHLRHEPLAGLKPRGGNSNG